MGLMPGSGGSKSADSAGAIRHGVVADLKRVQELPQERGGGRGPKTFAPLACCKALLMLLLILL